MPKKTWTHNPGSFYNVYNSQLFSDPVRPGFTNEFFPLLYADTWGDYWGYFYIYGKDKRSPRYLDGYILNEYAKRGIHPEWLETNFYSARSYLADINIIALFPSLLMLAAMIYAAIPIHSIKHRQFTRTAKIQLFLLTIVIISGAVFFISAIIFPGAGTGNTIKPTYILQVFPPLAILTAIIWQPIVHKSKTAAGMLLLLLYACWLFIMPALISHYSIFNLNWGRQSSSVHCPDYSGEDMVKQWYNAVLTDNIPAAINCARKIGGKIPATQFSPKYARIFQKKRY